MKPMIELRKDERRSDPVQSGGKSHKLNPGGFDVFVDGALWGRLGTDSLGPNGIAYRLYQVHATGGWSSASHEVPSTIHEGKTRTVYFDTHSDKVYSRRLKPGEQPVPLALRLTNLVAEALKVNALRDPAALKAEADKAMANRREREAMALQEKNALWLRKAKEALGPYAHGMTNGGVADLTARIVEAMKWAQTK